MKNVLMWLKSKTGVEPHPIFKQFQLLMQIIHAACKALALRGCTMRILKDAGYRYHVNIFGGIIQYSGVCTPRNAGSNLIHWPEIDLVILSSPKDLEMLPDVIEACRMYSLNPIREIFVIATPSLLAQTICRKLNVLLVDEDSVLPIQKRDISFISCGVDRSGWIWQQLLKLQASSVASLRDYAVIDADTILLQKHVFSLGRTAALFYLSDELHAPYRQTYLNLTGTPCSLPVSCVSHGMAFDRDMAMSLKKAIEAHTGLRWYEAIINLTDKTNPSAFSEYESYANYVSSACHQEVIFTHSHNLSISRSAYAFAKQVPGLLKLLSVYFRSISGHEKG